MSQMFNDKCLLKHQMWDYTHKSMYHKWLQLEGQ